MTSVIKDGRVVMFAPPMISGYSLTNGFEIKMQDKTGGSVEDFFAVVQGFLAQLNQQPEVQVAMTTFNPTSRSIWWISTPPRPSRPACRPATF